MERPMSPLFLSWRGLERVLGCPGQGAPSPQQKGDPRGYHDRAPPAADPSGWACVEGSRGWTCAEDAPPAGGAPGLSMRTASSQAHQLEQAGEAGGQEQHPGERPPRARSPRDGGKLPRPRTPAPVANLSEGRAVLASCTQPPTSPLSCPAGPAQAQGLTLASSKPSQAPG